MVVAVQRPAKKDDPFDKILKGVQLASGILGLKQQIDTEMAPKQDPNALTQKDILGAQQKGGLEFSSNPLEGGQEYKTASGPSLYVKSKPPELTPWQKKQDANADLDRTLKESGLKIEEAKLKSQNKIAALEADDKTKDKIMNSVDKFQTDKDTRDEASRYKSAQLVDQLISTGKPIQAQIALRKLFRISGDVGAIRAEDLQQLGSSPEYRERLANILNRAFSGETVRPEAIAEIKEAMAMMQKNIYNSIESRANAFSKKDGALIRGANQEDLLGYYNLRGLLGDGQFDVTKPQKDQNFSGGTTVLPGETTATGADNFDNRDTLLNELGGQ